MILSDEQTWPTALLRTLDNQTDLLRGYAQHHFDTMREYFAPKVEYKSLSQMAKNPYASDQLRIVEEVAATIETVSLQAWHCTRLTDAEIHDVQTHGLRLPSLKVLHERIEILESHRHFSARVAARLKQENLADDEHRRGMIWLYFLSPHHAGQSGIEQFFRSWGGEALYNLHESDAETGAALSSVGTPCIVRVDVSVSSLQRQTFLSSQIIRTYLLTRGFESENPVDHEDFVRRPIHASRIRDLVRFEEEKFSTLTGCDKWTPPLRLSR